MVKNKCSATFAQQKLSLFGNQKTRYINSETKICLLVDRIDRFMNKKL